MKAKELLEPVSPSEIATVIYVTTGYPAQKVARRMAYEIDASRVEIKRLQALLNNCECDANSRKRNLTRCSYHKGFTEDCGCERQDTI